MTERAGDEMECLFFAPRKLEFLPDGDDRSESTLRAGDHSGGKQASGQEGGKVGKQASRASKALPTTLMEREKRLEGQMTFFNLARTNKCMPHPPT